MSKAYAMLWFPFYRQLYKIVAVVIYIPIKPRKLQPKNKLPC